MRHRVLHILPEDGIGGAEIAAHSAADANQKISLFFMSPAPAPSPETTNIHHAKTGGPFSPTTLRQGMQVFDTVNPDVVVFSLWKSFFMMLLMRILRPRVKTVVMLHSSKFVHIPDFVCTHLMQLLAHNVWSDSESALPRVLKFKRKRARVISFLAQKPSPVTSKNPQPNFIFWGRLSAVKNLGGSCSFFQAIHAKMPNAKLTIIGPDDGELSKLKSHVNALGLSNAVHFVGTKSWTEICDLASDHSFYIQFSIFEGMAMSVVEAMQLGLVPIVTPVGEIKRYGKDGENCIIHDTTTDALSAVLSTLEDPEKYQRLRLNAQTYWQTHPTFAEDFYIACGEEISK